MTSTLDAVKSGDLRVVDADTHLTERHDLWTSRAPASMRDRMPHVEQVEGEATWVVEGNVMGRAGAGGVVGRDDHKGRSFEALYEWEIDRIHVGAYDPTARLEMMDEAGVHAQVIFPNNVGLGGQGLSQAVLDPSLRLLCVEMYNDSNAEMQEASDNRLLPMAVLPADPCTISMATSRTFRPAASARRAGSIASSRGSASVAPAPLRTARRDRCLLVMYMSSPRCPFPIATWPRSPV